MVLASSTREDVLDDFSTASSHVAFTGSDRRQAQGAAELGCCL